MTRVEIRSGRGRGSAPLVLSPGVHVLVGSDEIAADALLRVVAGVSRPQRLDVLIDGARPLHTPALRRSVGSLFRREAPPETRTVDEFLREALTLLESPLSPSGVLDAFGRGGWGVRSPASLSAVECRALALSLALSVPRPAVLALFEPLSVGLDRAAIVERLGERAASGAVVICRVSSVADAADVGTTGVVALEGGRLFRAPPNLTPWFASACFVRTDEPAALSKALAEDPTVTSVAWSEDDPAGEVSVTGPDAEGTALSILRASAASGAVLRSVRRAVAAPSSTAPPPDGGRP